MITYVLEMPQKSQSGAASPEAREPLPFNLHWEADEAKVGHQGELVAARTDVLTRADKWTLLFLWTINSHFSHCCDKIPVKSNLRMG